MPQTVGTKKVLVIVDTGDYAFAKGLAKDMKMSLKDVVLHTFKQLRETNPAELKAAIQRRSASLELERIREERRRLAEREKELQGSLKS